MKVFSIRYFIGDEHIHEFDAEVNPSEKFPGFVEIEDTYHVFLVPASNVEMIKLEKPKN